MHVPLEAPAEGEGDNLDRHLVPYHVKQGESNLVLSLYIYFGPGK